MYQGLVQAFRMRAVDGSTIEQLCWIVHGPQCRTVRQTLVCPASSIQVAMFRIDSWLGRRGDYVPSGRLWKKNERQRV